MGTTGTKKKPAKKATTRSKPRRPKTDKPIRPSPNKLPYKGWTLSQGVSQSLLQKFTNDEDRFHKHAVLGLRPVDRKEAMEYGTIFHKLIEEGARMGNKYTRIAMTRLMSEYIKKRYGNDEPSILLAKIAIAQYHQYRQWEAKKTKYKYIAQEPVFAEEYILPATQFNPCPEININIPRTPITLRGRIDEVIELNSQLWLQENKTKARIDISTIRDTVPSNIQVMFYAVAAQIKYGKPVRGIIYNIIRKPGQRQRQNESDEDFVDRIENKEIVKQPDYYFYRLVYQFPPGAVKKWEREELQPLLYKVYIWWKSIEKNPTNPWCDEEGNPNPFHGRKSFGIYDPMSNGKGEFFDLIVHGRKRGLEVRHEMFPELKDD